MTKILDEDFVQLNPDQRKRLREMIEEACGYKRLQQDKAEMVKEIVANAHETFGVPKKLMTKMITLHHKDSYIEESTEHEHMELYYESVFDDTDPDDV